MDSHGPLRLVPGETGTETLFFVEDETELARGMAAMLQRRGYAVHRFPDAESALSAAEAHAGPLDLLVTDVVLPGMGGAKLAEEIRGLWPELPVLFVSGYMSGVIVPTELDSPTGFIEKPFSGAALHQAIRTLLDNSK